MNQANETNPKLHVEHASTGTSARFWNKQMESDTKGQQGAPDTQSSNVVLHCRIDSEMDSLLLKTLPNFKIINQSIYLSIYQSINQSINSIKCHWGNLALLLIGHTIIPEPGFPTGPFCYT